MYAGVAGVDLRGTCTALIGVVRDVRRWERLNGGDGSSLPREYLRIDGED